jgi:hypothetical protein
MERRDLSVKITGITGLLENRDDLRLTHPEFCKKKTESYDEYEEKVWKEKAHWNLDNPRKMVFPSIWIRKMLIASQRQSANPIKPAGSRMAKDTLMKHFIGGVLLMEDPIVMFNGKPVTDDVLVPFKKMVSPSVGKVLCIRPMVPVGWSVVANLVLLNEMIRPEHIIECLTWAGTYNGCGDWRVEKGGNFGMFTVEIA